MAELLSWDNCPLISDRVKPLYPEIRVHAEIIGSENVKCILPWITPQVIAIFREDEKLESVRLAPSSVNSQPWYFVHEGDKIHAYCVLSGIIRKKKPSYMNLIDMGIALAQLYLCHPDTYHFSQENQVQPVKNYSYIGSFTL